MSYTALYRKFRPDCFEDVKGQEHIVTALRNQIQANRIGHAYLFCGTRGTGKTSIAKIFARAVNCQNPQNGSPCNECAICKSVQSGASMNVIEIDAASNNGVDNIREIRDEVQYSPTEGKYKVYIIDEVHMLSIGAFNALLKTLEEPPSYVIFILATTEAHKIPITILSRCQRYDFRRITIPTIAERLKELMRTEEIQTEDAALRYIAKAADGSMRDALSLLDQCLAFYMNQELTYNKVLEVLGAVDTEIFSSMFHLIADQDTLGAIKKLDEVIMSGRDLSQFIVDFIWYLRNLLLLASSHTIIEAMEVSEDNKVLMEEDVQKADIETIIRYIQILSDLSNQIKYASQKRVLVEIAVIKLTKPQMEQNYEAILSRLSLLEKKLEQGVIIKEETSVNKQETESIELPVSDKAMKNVVPTNSQEIVKDRTLLLSKLTPPLRNYVSGCSFRASGDGNLILMTSDEIAYGFLNNTEKKALLEEILSNMVQKQTTVDIQLVYQREKESNNISKAQQNIFMEISEED